MLGSVRHACRFISMHAIISHRIRDHVASSSTAFLADAANLQAVQKVLQGDTASAEQVNTIACISRCVHDDQHQS
jgi:hypothetical protein